MNLIQSNIKTMSSREIAIMTDKQHSKVMRTIEDLIDKGVAKMATLSPYVNPQNGQSYNEYHLDKRDSLVLVARLSPEFTAVIVDRWQELESQQTPVIPQTYAAALLEAGRLAQITSDQAEQLAIAAPKVEYHDKVLSSSNGLLTTEIAADFNMSAIKLNRLLEDLKVQRKVGGRWVLTAAMLGKNYTTEDTFIDESGKSRHSMRWTELGRKLIHELIEGVE